MPRGKKILKNIITGNMDAEIAIVCGKNKKLFSQAKKLKYKYDCNRLKVYGYIDFIYSLINISDVVVTKCGASTFMEVLLIGKVPVINNYIWEQEKGNMEYVCKGDMGILEKKPGLLPGVIHRLLTDSELYNSFSINIRNASIRNGVGQVSDYILNFQ
jgi:processive 1,2-diacylglycerol beta-glucosyltransferase/1,2-diacylglycerol 3-beta-galactosyltransferase